MDFVAHYASDVWAFLKSWSWILGVVWLGWLLIRSEPKAALDAPLPKDQPLEGADKGERRVDFDGFEGKTEQELYDAYKLERGKRQGLEAGTMTDVAHPKPALQLVNGEIQDPTFPEIIKDPRRALYHALKLLEEAGPIPGARIDWRDRCAMLLREWEP